MRILCFGDSNTYGYDPRSYFGGRYPHEHRWVDLLAEKTEWEIINAGENGREIPRREGELHRFRQLIKEMHPDFLLILLGGNDLLQGADSTETTERMDRFLMHVPLQKERILLLCPPPMTAGTWVTEERLVQESKALSVAFQTLADRHGIRFADAGAWGIDLAFDGVHFSEQGHRTFVEKLYSIFDGLIES